jgi:NAD(P)H-hydrate epimerase
MKIVDANSSRACDHEMINSLGYPSFALMENAARAFTDIFLKEYEPKAGKDRILILCGAGNNGGDGLAIARLLHLHGYFVEVSIVKTPQDSQSDVGKMYQLLKASGLMPQEVLPDSKYFDYLIDALVGTGVEGPLRPGTTLDWIQRLRKFKGKIIAVDIPSGLNASTGNISTEPLKADLTISFNSAKYCQVVYPAAEYCGKLRVVDIGILPNINARILTQAETADSSFVKQQVKGRDKNSHKGKGGHVLICGGSESMPGSVALSVKAAFRSGAGKVSLLAPDKIRNAVQKKILEAMSIFNPNKDTKHLTLEHLSAFEKEQSAFQVCALGPGMGKHPDTVAFMKGLLSVCRIPLILDADALNILAGHPEWWSEIPAGSILTPHPGEMQRLLPNEDVLNLRLESAQLLSKLTKCVVVLKGAGTIICEPGGKQLICTEGNPVLATAGSGDILTGVIAAMVAKGLPAFEAAGCGVALHALAADRLALKTLGNKNEKGKLFYEAGRVMEEL